jgi:hypothetical protein
MNPQKCPKCGEELSADAPQGLCPKCLVEATSTARKALPARGWHPGWVWRRQQPPRSSACFQSGHPGAEPGRLRCFSRGSTLQEWGCAGSCPIGSGLLPVCRMSVNDASAISPASGFNKPFPIRAHCVGRNPTSARNSQACSCGVSAAVIRQPLQTSRMHHVSGGAALRFD